MLRLSVAIVARRALGACAPREMRRSVAIVAPHALGACAPREMRRSAAIVAPHALGACAPREMRRSVAIIALIALIALGALAACAPREPAYPRRLDDIGALWSQIRAWRAEAGLALDPACAELVGFAPDGSSLVRDCSGRVIARSETCSLSEAICDNAEQICILAGDVRDNLWAHDKCISANASCREVQAHCTNAIGAL